MLTRCRDRKFDRRGVESSDKSHQLVAVRKIGSRMRVINHCWDGFVPATPEICSDQAIFMPKFIDVYRLQTRNYDLQVLISKYRALNCKTSDVK